MNRKAELIEEALNDLIGHIAMESVTSYIPDSINEKYGTEFANTDELVEFLQANHAEINECPNCGWYVDYLTCYATDEDDEEIEINEAICETCAQYY